MRKVWGEIARVVYSFIILAGLVFISFNLPHYNSYIVAIAIVSLILASAAWIYRLVELWASSSNKLSIFETAGISEILTIDQHYQRGKSYHLQGKSNRAIREFKKILSINSEDSDVYYQLGKIYREKGRNKEATKFLKRYLELDKEKKWKEEVEELLPTIK